MRLFRTSSTSPEERPEPKTPRALPARNLSDAAYLRRYFKTLLALSLLGLVLVLPYTWWWLYESGDVAVERAVEAQAEGEFALFGSGVSQDFVDYVVVVDSIGDPNGIVSGTTKVTSDPIGLKIAAAAAELIDATGYIKEGMSCQTGAGGTSLAVAAEIKKRMQAKGVVGSFGAGGITAYFVEMLNEGLFRALFDVQDFDLVSVASAGSNPKHMAMSGSLYGNPHNCGPVVNNLDIMILGATEIDTDFNVNVVTGSDGTIMGASGGHNDTAAGSKISIVVTNLLKGRLCVLRDHVTTVTSPGETIDALVTDRGIAINPRRTDLLEKLKDSKLPIMDIQKLKEIGDKLAGKPDPIEFTDRIVGVVEYRDGTVIDVVRQPK